MSDGTTPGPLARLSLFDRLVVGMNALGSVWILLMVLMVTTDAMSRSFFAKPIAGVTELIQISIIGIVFLQIADAIRTKRMTRADSLSSPYNCAPAYGLRDFWAKPGGLGVLAHSMPIP